MSEKWRRVSFEVCGVRLCQGVELSEEADRYLSSLGSKKPSPHDVLYGFLNWLRDSKTRTDVFLADGYTEDDINRMLREGEADG